MKNTVLDEIITALGKFFGIKLNRNRTLASIGLFNWINRRQLAQFQLVERQAGNRKVANLGSTPDAVARRCVLGKHT